MQILYYLFLTCYFVLEILSFILEPDDVPRSELLVLYLVALLKSFVDHVKGISDCLNLVGLKNCAAILLVKKA